MTLQDHFRPPLSERRHWHSFHTGWAACIAAGLNARLPEGYFAEPNVQFGIEIDVATFEEADPAGSELRGAIEPYAISSDSSWSDRPPTRTLPITLLEDVNEVLLFSQEGGPTLAGAIELVSPSNKDRPERREAFISKCAAYVQQGIGLLIVDIVTDRQANLHQELLARLHPPGVAVLQDELHAAAYRPVRLAGEPRLEIWEEPLAVGRSLPVMPLWLRGGLCVPVDLDGSYERTCREQRVIAGVE